MYIVWIAFSTFFVLLCDSNNNYHITAIIQINLRYLAPPVKNWRILLVPKFTAHMPLLVVMATSTIGLGRRRWISSQQCYLRCLCTLYSCNSFLINIVITRCRQSPALTHLAASLATCVQKQTVLWITRN